MTDKNIINGNFNHKGEPEGPAKEADGCPTEGAVLKRFWRSIQSNGKLWDAIGEYASTHAEFMDARGAAMTERYKAWQEARANLVAIIGERAPDVPAMAATQPSKKEE
jgi:hypothetical protein